MNSKAKRPSGRMTAAEHEIWLRETGQLAAIEQRQREQEEIGLKREADYRIAEKPLVEDLQAAGFKVNSAWDFVNTRDSYPDALPILLDHLSQPYPPAVREGIARAMAVPQSRFAWKELVHLYCNEDAGRARDGLAVAIAAAADFGVLDELIALAKDRALGSSRVLLLRALARSTDSKARAALMELGTDPDLAKEVQVILKRLRSKTRTKTK